MPINVVLFEPEIPQNTGNIIRTCVATNTKLHLIEPLGFDLYKKDVKRSTANHLEGLNYQTYCNYEEFVKLNEGEYFFITRYATKNPNEFKFDDYSKNIYLIFGKESSGLPYELLKDHLEQCIRIPMSAQARSLNLSNCVAIMVYDLLKQFDYESLSLFEVQKGKDFLNNI
ncbi:MAG: tRNA (cytidine(34)-2'-O)-methyltransferase [Bacilli bacterium]|jgi:tRNA (cytidine/uridine-2'-O-)-methyltransferase|nr:tRNA (cytidine(34)-2'-O)-methyltransferase [Bacilli bacterium]